MRTTPATLVAEALDGLELVVEALRAGDQLPVPRGAQDVLDPGQHRGVVAVGGEAVEEHPDEGAAPAARLPGDGVRRVGQLGAG